MPSELGLSVDVQHVHMTLMMNQLRPQTHTLRIASHLLTPLHLCKAFTASDDALASIAKITQSAKVLVHTDVVSKIPDLSSTLVQTTRPAE